MSSLQSDTSNLKDQSIPAAAAAVVADKTVPTKRASISKADSTRTDNVGEVEIDKHDNDDDHRYIIDLTSESIATVVDSEEADADSSVPVPVPSGCTDNSKAPLKPTTANQPILKRKSKTSGKSRKRASHESKTAEGEDNGEGEESEEKEELAENALRKQFLVEQFTKVQYERYEISRSSHFPRPIVRRLMEAVTGAKVSQPVVIAMAGIAKAFIGEIMEESLDVKDAEEERAADADAAVAGAGAAGVYGDDKDKDADVDPPGPIRPKHIREAVRRLKLKGTVIMGGKKAGNRYNPYTF